ncbi:hypothetical protein UPYG_G00224520 [Umbra pygmaea]|uniref:Centrosomal protein kizuna n=1 Tax=Umbra pygmaea TaxID=75934 RepID=A0ABD0WYA8_UMBPY
MAFCRDQYYERIGSIQQGIHEREKRRLELEGELFAYCRSDQRVSQIKCMKLRGYLKEICEREKRAKMRNHELLKDVELMEMSMKEHYPDHSSLQHHKVECLNRVSRFMAAGQKAKKTDLGTDTGDVLHMHPQGDILSPLDQVLHPPSLLLTGAQSFRVSTAKDVPTSVHLPKAEHHSPNDRSHDSDPTQSGLLSDSEVSKQDVSDSESRLSGDFSGTADSPDGSNLSDKHQRRTAVLPSSPALTASACVPFGGDEKPPTLGLTLTRPEKNSLWRSSNSHMCDRNSPAECTQDGGFSHQHSIKEDVGGVLQRSPPQTDLEKESQDVLEKSESLSLSSSSMNLTLTSSGDDLSIALVESDLPEVPKIPKKVRRNRSQGPPGSTAKAQESQLCSIRIHSQVSLDRSEPKDGPESSRESATQETPMERLSMEAFVHLLEGVEEHILKGRSNVYLVSSVGDSEHNKVISLCNARADLNEQDLDACGAVVLHQLQRLSWSMSKGCLLPEEVVRSNWSSNEPVKISSSLSPDAAPLWERWFKHALLLRDHRVLTTKRLVQLFTPLLLPFNASYSTKAKVLLRTLLSQPSEESPSVGSSSIGLPSLLYDGAAEIQPARPVPEHGAAGAHGCYGLQSGEEDSQDDSVPIRETKAYQLLKQSAQPDRQHLSSGEEDEDLSGVDEVCEEDTGRFGYTSPPDPYPGKGNKHIQSSTAVQSKAFWGESDDSNSEIEAALRPKLYSINNDDSGDFFD